MVATFSGSVTVNALPPPPGDGLSVTITRDDDGSITTYTQTESATLGSYVDPEGAFTQQCFVAPYKSTFPGLRIYFRPDATSARQEIVFEYGAPLDTPAQTPRNSPGYTARVYDGTTLLYTSPFIPIHYWLTRWRWNPTPRAIRKTPTQVRETGIVPNINSPPVISAMRPDLAPRSYTIMGSAGMWTGMPSTGDRPDIGIIPEWSADWLSTGAIADTVLAHGESIGSADIVLRNPTTHSPINLATSPYTNAARVPHATSVPYVPEFSPSVFVWDAGHHPNPAIVPFLMTGDPYFLEHCQFISNRAIMETPPGSRYNTRGRYLAWPLRDQLYSEQATPTTVPGWILPKSSFVSHINSFKAWIINIHSGANNPMGVTLATTYFHSNSFPVGPNDVPWYPTDCSSAPWQEAFVCAVFALSVQHGRSDWLPLLEWEAHGPIKRHSGTDGYYRATPTPSRFNFHYTAETTTVTTSGMTTLTLNEMSAEPWPAVPFNIKWNQRGATVEVMTVTAKVGNVFTVTRAVSGTVRASAPIGSTIKSVNQIATWAEMAARQQGAYPATQYGFSSTDPTGNVHIRHKEPGIQTGNIGYISNGFAGLGLAIANGIADATNAEIGYDWLEDELLLWAEPTWVAWRNWDIAKTLA